MPNEQSNNNRQNDVQEKSVVVSAEMVQDIVKEIIELEQDHLYVNRANLKEQIVTLIKTKVR